MIASLDSSTESIANNKFVMSPTRTQHLDWTYVRHSKDATSYVISTYVLYPEDSNNKKIHMVTLN